MDFSQEWPQGGDKTLQLVIDSQARIIVNQASLIRLYQSLVNLTAEQSSNRS